MRAQRNTERERTMTTFDISASDVGFNMKDVVSVDFSSTYGRAANFYGY